MNYLKKLFCIVIVLIIAGCNNSSITQSSPTIARTNTSGTSYPISKGSSLASSYPSSTLADNKITAFAAYKIALPYALKWNAKAVLYTIPATFQQEANFGHPANSQGWYFMFKDPSSVLEYYIYIYQGGFEGGIEAQQVTTGTKPPYSFQPLPDLSKMIDSDKVIELYMNNGGKDYMSANPKAVLNPQLTYLEGDANPIWRLFDGTKKGDYTVLFSVNAYNGDIIK